MKPGRKKDGIEGKRNGESERDTLKSSKRRVGWHFSL